MKQFLTALTVFVVIAAGAAFSVRAQTQATAPADPVAAAASSAPPAAAAQPATTPPPAAAGAAAPAPAAPTGSTSYRYAWSDCEYSVELPEAPKVRSIWDTDTVSSRFEKPILLGQIGEAATYKRVNIATGDSISADVMCMKTTSEFLNSLTMEKMHSSLGTSFKGKTMQGLKKNYSKGAETLSWATIAGYGFDKDKKTVFRVGHYLTGLTTIALITIEVSAENKEFMQQYDLIDKSITLNKD